MAAETRAEIVDVLLDMGLEFMKASLMHQTCRTGARVVRHNCQPQMDVFKSCWFILILLLSDLNLNQSMEDRQDKVYRYNLQDHIVETF